MLHVSGCVCGEVGGELGLRILSLCVTPSCNLNEDIIYIAVFVAEHRFFTLSLKESRAAEGEETDLHWLCGLFVSLSVLEITRHCAVCVSI